ncbi:MAG: GAK system CofD-like protein [Gammaproteobacteria bacterium]|jgi:CofD-related protein of GAK system|nr:GAK system CofD-like protein [Gammaproteobacteria bacterium]MBT3721827.1 GAK system CofD-like protein [Gammaproteobacteria bacterium]MBT4078332.1 GAK system CofD-like protein [Gammaproteobacteria bacterium]MBT4196107.1 GAK system CofD-like protein [Gammaproteobacteria bacterium]MBT4451777.1 GAK system CofD-like protein [Gammaproteobacteria bacterium]
MNSIHVTRAVQMPDLLRAGRYRKSPELGPHMLFFSGGSALNQFSQVLKLYTHNSVHMVTPFDSGGSSAELRKTFQMPSIGDLRSRLMALADETITGHPEVYQLFTHRLNKNSKNSELLLILEAMCSGKDELVRAVPNPMRRLIRTQLGYFIEAMPPSFNLRGASIGNLILTGGYLNNHQHLDPIIFLFSKLVGVRGTVRATVNDNLSLGADLADGSRIIGQHRLTGKEKKPLASQINKIFLSADPDRLMPAQAKLRKKNRKLITNAELICYPPGSFYTSLIANLLPDGVGKAIASNDCPKVYIPNLGQDPEQIGMTMDSSIKTLLQYLRADAGSKTGAERLINFILLDSRFKSQLNHVSADLLKELGIQLIDTKLVSKSSVPLYDPELLVAALLSLT